MITLLAFVVLFGGRTGARAADVLIRKHGHEDQQKGALGPDFAAPNKALVVQPGGGLQKESFIEIGAKSVSGHSVMHKIRRPDGACSLPLLERPLRGVESHGRTVDLVISFFCEDVHWLNNLNPKLASEVAVFIMNKSPHECPESGLAEFLAKSAFAVTTISLENLGRDGHSQTAFIRRYYEKLADWSVFVQAGFHWFAEEKEPNFHGWFDQASMLNDVIPRLLSNSEHGFVPLVRSTLKGPNLATDDRVWGDLTNSIDNNGVWHFNPVGKSMFNQARELYSIWFGGSPCDAPPVQWAPGMQYAVHREHILVRSCSDWQAMEFMLAQCSEQGWAFERLTTLVFNSSLVMLPPSQWKVPTWCPWTDTHKEAFSDDKNYEKQNAFFREHWHCEPLK